LEPAGNDVARNLSLPGNSHLPQDRPVALRFERAWCIRPCCAGTAAPELFPTAAVTTFRPCQCPRFDDTGPNQPTIP
jgi:hypothetical protein